MDQRKETLLKIAEECFAKNLKLATTANWLGNQDVILHDDPYFSDKSVWGSEANEPDSVAVKFTLRAANLDAQAAQLYIDFPTMENGFFKQIPKLKQNGQEMIDESGHTVMKEVPDYIGIGGYLGKIIKLKTTKAFSYVFDEDHYKTIDDLALKSKIDALTLFKRDPRHIGEFLRAAIYKNYCPDSFFKEPDGYINLKNGILDIQSGEVKPNDGALFFKYVLPHVYDETAKCDRWLEFLDFVFEGNKELADLSAEIFGYILSGGTPWLHKAFFLEGSGRNGKSTWLDVLKNLIGESNYCSIPMRNLDKPFSVVMADGKLANIVGELEGKDMSSEVFKIAVGGEELTAAHKGKPEYQLKFNARLVFAMNNPPQFKDTSAGNYERLCILPFKRFIGPDERDPHIMSKLLPELPGILNWALIGLVRLKARGRLPKINAVEETLKEYRTGNDSVYQWATEWVKSIDVPNEGPPNQYVLGAFWKHYCAWCKDEGRYPVSKPRFGKELGRELRSRYPTTSSEYPNNKLRCTGPFKITASINRYGDLDLLNFLN